MKDFQTLQLKLFSAKYIVEDELATAVYLAINLQRPLLLEGEAGVGKTSIANALANALNTNLIRLQCYEGLDSQSTIYEWNYQKQLLAIRLKDSNKEKSSIKNIFTEEYLLERPLLKAISQKQSPVLLIDEIDRADEEFEAFLLEILSDYQITIPEIGSIKAKSIPICILTSNSNRQLSDALRRRCLYHYLSFPAADKEVEIIKVHNPNIDENLIQQAVKFVNLIRKENLEKKPGIAETLDWISALTHLKIATLNNDNIHDGFKTSLMCLLKSSTDRLNINQDKAESLLEMIN